MASSIATFDAGMATFVFGADTAHGQQDETVLVGDHGTLRAVGNGLNQKRVFVHTAAGHSEPVIEGTWFEQGFEGTMAELLCAIEQEREPTNSARDNLTSLALTFAAVTSADTGKIELPGTIRSVSPDHQP
jgi:predicted dehydrogenase